MSDLRIQKWLIKQKRRIWLNMRLGNRDIKIIFLDSLTV